MREAVMYEWSSALAPSPIAGEGGAERSEAPGAGSIAIYRLLLLRG